MIDKDFELEMESFQEDPSLEDWIEFQAFLDCWDFCSCRGIQFDPFPILEREYNENDAIWN